MKNIPVILAVSFLLLTTVACEPSPKPIAYGNVACAYCRMNIVDKRYAAQLVSTTGKAFSFDAMECMIHYRGENENHDWQLELVTDYSQPGKLFDADEAHVLRSHQLPSPMGMFLTALPNREVAQELKEKHGGFIYTYRELCGNIENLPPL